MAEEKFSLEYEGKTIYFCCNSCIKDFIANPDAYISNISTLEESTHNDGHDHSHNTINESGEQHIHNSDSEHDHATDHNQSNTLLTLLGKLHPLAIHFPIALVFTALLFTSLSLLFNQDIFEKMSVYIIYLAAVSAVLSTILGLIAGSSAEYPSFLESTLDWHRILGIASSVGTLLTAFLGYRLLSHAPSGRALLYRLVLLFNAILIGVTGHYGATLVYGLNYFNF